MKTPKKQKTPPPKGVFSPTEGQEKGRRYYTLGLDGFIRKARLVHGEKYDYSKVVYVNNRTKVAIVCPIHGEFCKSRIPISMVRDALNAERTE